jgi:Ca2+ transporting ATPase
MEGADFIKLVGGVVCKNCDTSVCECAKDQKQADEEGKKLRIDTIKNG